MVVPELRTVTRRLLDDGAVGVVLTGSHARREAHDRSDIDLVAVGAGTSAIRLEGGQLVSIAWAKPDEVRASWRDPGMVGQTVPGWQHAVSLADPHGIIKELQGEAHRWQWTDLGRAPDRWAASEITAYAEDVQRLVGHLEAGRRWPAAVMRNILASHMAKVASVHLRLLYATENRLWDLVGDRLGEPWRTDQSAALGVDGSDLTTSCRAALRLYRRAAHLIDPVLAHDQRVVVHAVLAQTAG